MEYPGCLCINPIDVKVEEYEIVELLGVEDYRHGLETRSEISHSKFEELK